MTAGARILIVDHDRELLRVLSEYVAICGYEAHQVEDVDRVVPLAAELRPAAILLDVRMPGSNGVELLEELRRRIPECPVIMINGQEDPAPLARLFDLGARDCLTKPFDLPQLRQSLAETISRGRAGDPPEEVPSAGVDLSGRRFASVADYMRAFREAPPGDLALVPISLAAEYLGVTPTGVTQMARRGEMREIVVQGARKRWIGVGLASLIRRHENAGSLVPELAGRVRGELEILAAERRTCGLLDVMPKVDLDPRVPRQRRLIHDALALLSAESYRKEGFLLSAICSMTSLGRPSNAFFNLAERLGALRDGMDRDRFHKAQLLRIFTRFHPGARGVPARPSRRAGPPRHS